MPRLPRNLHFVTTWRSPDNAIGKKHPTRQSWSVAPATRNDDGGLQSAAPATKTATHLLKTTRKHCACRTKTIFDKLWNMLECHTVPCLPRETRLRNVWNLQKGPFFFCRTRHRHGHRAHTRTVADGCERLPNVWRTQPQPPNPRSETGTLARHSGKKTKNLHPFRMESRLS